MQKKKKKIVYRMNNEYNVEEVGNDMLSHNSGMIVGKFLHSLGVHESFCQSFG
jgi:hypothetical protein